VCMCLVKLCSSCDGVKARMRSLGLSSWRSKLSGRKRRWGLRLRTWPLCSSRSTRMRLLRRPVQAPPGRELWTLGAHA